MKKWETLAALMDELNEKCNYIVLRNYEDLQVAITSDDHADIDFLCDDMASFVEAAGAERRDKAVHHHKILIGKTVVPIDVRTEGDGYYDAKWERHLLNNRKLFEDFCYVPSDEDHLYSLMYHALIHKKVVTNEYMERINSMKHCPERNFDRTLWLKELESYMKNNGYKYTYPGYPGTGFYIDGVDKRLIRRDNLRKFKRYINGLLIGVAKLAVARR